MKAKPAASNIEVSKDAEKIKASVGSMKALLEPFLLDIFDQEPQLALLAQVIIELKKKA